MGADFGADDPRETVPRCGEGHTEDEDGRGGCSGGTTEGKQAKRGG